MNTLTIAWLAGLVEGEGCFYYRIRKVKAAKGRFRFKETALITISSTDRDVMEKVSRLWKSNINIRYSGVNKNYYTTVINGKRAISWMFTIYPFLGARRRAKIKEIISWWRIR